MPRVSRRQKAVEFLHGILANRIRHRAIRMLEDEEDSLEDVKDWALARSVKAACGRRYLFRNGFYRRGDDRFTADLQDKEDNEDELNMNIEAEVMPWLTDDEFLQKYRCCCHQP